MENVPTTAKYHDVAGWLVAHWLIVLNGRFKRRYGSNVPSSSQRIEPISIKKISDSYGMILCLETKNHTKLNPATLFKEVLCLHGKDWI